MGTALLAFGTAIVGAIVGAYLQKRWTPDLSPEITALRQQVADFQARIETLEGERNRRETIGRFAPQAEIKGEPPEEQNLLLTGDRQFEVRRLDYIADTGATIAYEELKRSGKIVQLPINKSKVMQVWNLLPRQAISPISMKLRCHLVVDDLQREVTIEAMIKPEFKFVNNTHTFFLKVTTGL